MKNKIIIFSIIFLCPYLVNANFYSEIWSGAQLNHPTASSVAASVGRIRLGSIFQTQKFDYKFHLRGVLAYGRETFGSTGIMTPVNDVTADPHEFTIDEGYFLFQGRYVTFTAGVIDPFDKSDGYSGFFTPLFIEDENSGFLSTHILRLLANNGLDSIKNQSISAVLFYIQMTENIRLKTGLTFGQATEHLFLRNTLPLEIELNTLSFHLSLNAGFADAHSSLTHKISPSYGMIIDKKLFGNLVIFGKFSSVEQDLKTFRTPNMSISNNYLVAQQFSLNRQHISAGLEQQFENFGWGIGYSILKQFNKTKPEQLIEVFTRFRIAEIFNISPDFQYILNPNGNTQNKYMWIAGFRFFYKFNF